MDDNHDFPSSHDLTVYDIKQMISKSLLNDSRYSNLHPERQNLYFNGIKLESDHKSVEYYNPAII